jgi:hypothetical protein
MSNIDDLSDNGRLVGWTYRYNPIPHRPWTVINGGTTWLPVPDPMLSHAVQNLRVNACGSIVATQVTNNGEQRGLLYSKIFCDPPRRI